MPPTDLLPLCLLHFLPMVLLFFSAAVLTHRNPANHLLALHAASVVYGNHQRDIRKLKKGDLEDERLLVDGVWLSTTDGGLAPRHLLAHGVEKAELPIGI